MENRKEHFCVIRVSLRIIFSEINNRTFSNDLSKFVYVGELIERKCAISIISALNRVYKNEDFHMTYVGRGS